MGVNVSEVFGQNVFDESVMKNRLPEATYNEMKEWAVEKVLHIIHMYSSHISFQ